MKDPEFVEKMAARASQGKEIVGREFGYMVVEQLNWKQYDETWSVGQCIDHLVVSDCLYFPSFKRVSQGTYKMKLWERINPFSGLFGRMLSQQLQEKVKKKIKAPKVFEPSYSQIDVGVLDRFQKHLDTLIEYINGCRSVDLDKIHITSPVSKMATYSLRHAITILVQHLHRHINQALRVKALPDFPL